MTHITFIIPSLQQGGLENAVSVLVNQLAKLKNIKISIICFYNNPIFYQLNDNVAICMPPFKRKGISTISYYLKSYQFIIKQLKQNKPDRVISYGDYVNSISILASKSCSLPIFVSDRSSPAKRFPMYIKMLRKLTYRKANGIIAQTLRAKDQKVAMLGKGFPIKVIPNPVRPIQVFEESKKQVILCVARHYHVKGIDRLLEAFSKVNDTSWCLEIAGSVGPETEQLLQHAKKLRIDDRVNFLGARKDIDRIYSYASIFVLPSRSEGLPNALIEAMAHGLPCISFDINAGPSDVIEHEVNGILVEDGNIDELANKIKELIENKEKRDALGRKAMEIKEKLSIDRITDELLTFIGISNEHQEQNH
jgi:GalNAc-alpha-(1->4)-GalNAc-alpha-(1->3)-diNAcBac-PP-undecaprenol alpha-1,4-N-acetyl-D-galactosaminyltransferase